MARFGLRKLTELGDVNKILGDMEDSRDIMSWKTRNVMTGVARLETVEQQ